MKAACSPREISLKLSEREATILCALIGGVMWNVDSDEGRLLSELFWTLDGFLPDRTESFGDFFTGHVESKGVHE